MTNTQPRDDAENGASTRAAPTSNAAPTAQIDGMDAVALANFLTRLARAEAPRVRGPYEMLRALIRTKDALPTIGAFGEGLLPFPFREPERRLYGQMFDLWCDAAFKAAPRPEALELVRRVVDAERRLNGEHPWSSLYHAATRFDQRDPDGAFDDFAKVAAGDEHALTSNAHGASSVRPVAFIGDLDLDDDPLGMAPFSPPISEPGGDRPMVHLVACDGRYWDVFHERLFASIAAVDANVIVHAHVLNPPADAETLTARARALQPGLSVAVTTEQFELPSSWRGGWGDENLRAFYTFLRFARAADILEHYKKPLLITEFDAELSPRVNSVHDATRDCDASLVFYTDAEPNYFPWGAVWAGTVVVNPTAGGIEYMRRVAAYNRRVFAEGVAADRPMWHVDQNALFLVYAWFRAHRPDVRIASFPDDRRPLSRNFGNAASR